MTKDKRMNETLDGLTMDEAILLNMKGRLMVADDFYCSKDSESIEVLMKRLKDHDDWVLVNWDLEDFLNKDGSPVDNIASELIHYREITTEEVRDHGGNYLKDAKDYFLLQEDCERFLNALIEGSGDIEADVRILVTKTYRPEAMVGEHVFDDKVKLIMQNLKKGITLEVNNEQESDA